MNDKTKQSNTNSISECLAQVVNLTKKNLAILKAVNEAFYTKRNHLAVIVDDETYVIPSFISLESRIETLEQNLQNIVDAPLTGEAFTYFNGTTQKIELSGYHTAPNSVELNKVERFGVETNNIFKDFMTPNPYVKIGISSIPNHIKHVMVHKVTIHEQATDLQSMIDSITVNGQIDFADMEKILYGFNEGEDYVEYDTVKRLPIRKGVAQGEYEIKDIIDNYQDSNFDEFYELELTGDLVYYINNGTIQRDIKVGDTLVTYNDKVIMEITDLNAIKRTITVKILQGAYADLQDKTSNNPDLYKLKYFKDAQDTELSKYINVPLEEDQYVIIFVAPINDTTNTRAPWGKGIFIDTNDPGFQTEIDGESVTFREYYNKFVNNVGDALVSITSMMDDDQQVSRLTKSQFDIIRKLKPVINKDIISVTQINKHLDDSKSIQAIRKLYDQKNKYKDELNTIQQNIDQINKSLSELAFDDSSNVRTVYETQLSEYNIRKSEITTAMDKILNEISISANNSETPIENAKYRIRGFIPVNLQDISSNIPDFVDVIKLDVEYRYKNKSNFTGNAKVYGDGEYIFSDWNKMSSIYRKRVVGYEKGHYIYQWEELNDNTNNPSFNQIDIPITQGEVVDIRVRFVYNAGYPFVELRSDWSNIYTQTFPVEYLKNVDILDIISENNDEIKTRHFEKILNEKGIITHVDDSILDQNIRYLHKAEHISSGFLTEERRIIPLDTKLIDFNRDIEELKSEVYGANSTNLIITLSDDNNVVQLKPNIFNKFHTRGYMNSVNDSSIIKFNNMDNEERFVALSQLTLNLYNNGSYDMKLHSIFPGSYGTELNPTDNTIFPITDYVSEDEKVFMLLDRTSTDSSTPVVPQGYNQFIYFRRILTDIAGNPSMYIANGTINQLIVSDDGYENNVPKNKLLGSSLNVFEGYSDADLITIAAKMDEQTGAGRFACMYPYIGNESLITLPTNDTFIVLAPGESISIPINFVYWFNTDSNDTSLVHASEARLRMVSRMMAFDIRTSLYQDPITYKFIVDASYSDMESFVLKKTKVAGVDISKLQKYTPSTPKTIASNTTSLIRGAKSTNILRVNKRNL